MKKNITYLFLLPAALLTLSLGGCRKKEKYDTTAAEDNAMAEAAFSDAFNQVDDAARNNNAVYRTGQGYEMLSQCATVTVTPMDSTWPKTLVVDFGTTNCAGIDGKNRRGKLTAVVTGRYRDAGTVITITTQDYHVNDMKVEGTKTITNNGLNSNGNLSYSIVVAGGKVTNADKSITWESTRTREWTAGADTWTIWDDEYEISGSANGTSSEGSDYTVQITSPLRVELDCRWITTGTFELTVEDFPVRKVDYGNGNCDSQATLTIKNKTYNITLR